MTFNRGARTEEIFQESRRELWESTDRMFAVLMMIQWFGAIVFAFCLTPTEWEGANSAWHVHIYTAIFLGGWLAALPVYLIWRKPGAPINRCVIGFAQMAYSALFIHLTGGRIETHFHVFGSLAFLALYKDCRVLVIATAVTAADHFLRGYFAPVSIYGVLASTHWRALEHTAWVVFEDIFLIYSMRNGLRQARLLSWHQAELEEALLNVEQKVDERTRELTASREVILAQQNSLVASAKTSALGEMASQIAHEINTPLGAIVLAAERLRQCSIDAGGKLDPRELNSKIEFILQVTSKITRIIHSMRQLAGHGANEDFNDVSVKSLIDDTLLLCAGRFAKDNIQLEFINSIPEGTLAHCRANEIAQVLVNLLNNAHEAVKGQSDGWARLETTCDSHQVYFRLTDSGRGISPDQLNKLFAPRFTTKSLDLGTGFGLSVSKQIVERHGGAIYVDTDCANTSFVFHIPLARSEKLVHAI